MEAEEHAEIAVLKKQLAALREVLKRVEFIRLLGAPGEPEVCAMCWHARPEHHPDCELKAALDAARGKEPK
jgi:hypothetical protein